MPLVLAQGLSPVARADAGPMGATLGGMALGGIVERPCLGLCSDGAVAMAGDGDVDEDECGRRASFASSRLFEAPLLISKDAL